MSAENKARGSGEAGEQGSESDAPRRWRPATDHWPLLAILAAFLLLGLATSAINPLHEATDELRHYRFIQHIIQRHALPVQGQTSDLPCTIQGHHPPLYYATAALLTFWIDTGRDICYEPPTNPFWDYRYWDVGRDNKNQYLHGPDEAFPWRGEALAAHLARVVNLLFGAATVWLTWATARLIWPRRPALAAGSAAFVAFNPMFLYMAAAINNDVAAAMAGAAVTYACVRLLRDPHGLRPAWGVALGALYALALLSKFNLAAIIVVIEAAVTWVAWRRGQWRQWLVVNALLVGVTALLAGWWFVRNQRLYGEPTGIEELTQLWGVRDPRESFWLAVSELPYAWTSLWGRFGYGQIPLPGWMYGALFAVLLLAVGGYGVALLRRLSSPPMDQTPSPKGRGLGRGPDVLEAPSPNSSLREGEGPVLALLALTVAVFFAVLFNYLLVSPAGPMGRFFFPALPALGILMFYGLTLWGEGRGARFQVPGEEAHAKALRGQDAKAEKKLAFLPWRLGFFAPWRERFPLDPGTWTLEPSSPELILAWAVNLGLIALSLVALFGYLRLAYARPPVWAEGATRPNPITIQFDTLVQLRGYAIDTTAVRPGEPIGIDLYWEVTGRPPGDYLLFVHLVDSETGALVAQRDTHPGLGNFPSSQWQPGDRFVERLRLYVPETAYVPAMAEVRVGLYAPGSYRLGITDAATGAGLGDSFPLGGVALTPAAPDAPLPNAGIYRFEDRFRLAGYAYDRRIVPAGEPLTVTLYWTVGPAPAAGYDVQVRLLDEAGNVVHHEQRPLGVGWPASEDAESAAAESAVVADVHVIPGDPNRPPGNYTVQVSVEGADDRRLQLVGEDGRWLDYRLLLSAVRVTD